MSDNQYSDNNQQITNKKAKNSWVMYDWANSAFATSIYAAILPVYYASVAVQSTNANTATIYWSYTTTISLVLVALAGPILGAIADFSGKKKFFLSLFAIFGIIGTGLLYLVQAGDWLLASVLLIIGSFGFSGANVFYDSLLPHVARAEEIDQVSSRGYAMGYLGGGIMLAINLAMIMLVPEEHTNFMTRLTFVTVALWWLLFTIPLWRNVAEPERRLMSGEEKLKSFQAGIFRLKHTFGEIKKYRQLLKFIIAFWLYNNGIGTVIIMAGIYGKELGFSDTTIIGTLLMVQFVAMPFAFFFGWLAKKIGTKPAIFLCLLVYTFIAIGGFLLQTETHFWILGFAVATVQGGSQALSRSLCGRMMPKSKSAEFFSFFSISEKIAGAVGPLIFGVVSQIMGGSRLSIVALIIFFIAGAILLSKVDENEGINVAKLEETTLTSAAV